MNSLKVSVHNRAYSFLEWQGRVFTPTRMIILWEPDNTVQYESFVCSQPESPVSFCKPVRAVTDGIMLQNSILNGLFGRQKLLGRFSWCLYPPFLPPTQNGRVSHSLGQKPESKRWEAKDATSLPSGDVQKRNILWVTFSFFPMTLSH